jgi:uncharacterized membrane protein
LGLALEMLGYVLYTAALAGAPVSMLAVAMQGGIGLFVALSVVFLGERARPGEWLGIGLAVAAALLLASSAQASDLAERLDRHAMELFSAAVLALSVAAGAADWRRQSGRGAAILSGLAFGMGSLYLKALIDTYRPASLLSGQAAAALLANPYGYLLVAANVAGLAALQNAFHQARAVIVMPLSSVFSNAVPIVGGLLVLGERLPSGGGAQWVRLLAFVLAAGAGFLLTRSDPGASSPG